VAIFTGTLWLSTLLLWWATRGTLKHAKETTELDERGYRIDKNALVITSTATRRTFRDASPSRAQVNSPERRSAAQASGGQTTDRRGAGAGITSHPR
jgi:hypothetical protein